MTPRWVSRIAHLTGVLVSLALLLAIGLNIASVAAHTAALDLLEYGEGPLAAFVIRWTQEPPSASWSAIPFTGAPYGPLMLGVWRTAATIWPSADVILVGRLVALAATTGLAVLVATIVFRRHRSATAALTAVALLLASPAAEWYSWARVDTMAAALTAAAYLALGRDARRLTLAAALIVLASLAKQTAAVHILPLAFAAWMLWGGRTALRLALVTAVLGIVAWGGMASLYDGYFLETSMQTASPRLSPWMYVRAAQPWLTATSTIWMLSAAYFYATVRGQAALRDRWWIGCVFATVFGAFTSFREGSYVNYFIDATWLGAIVAAGVCAELLPRWPTAVRVGITLVALLSVPPLIASHLEWRVRPSSMSAEHAQQVLEWSHRGPVLLDGDLVGLVPREVRPLINDSFLFRLRDDAGRAPTELLLEQLSQPATTVVLSRSVEAHIDTDRLERYWPEAILQRIASDFCLSGRPAKLYVYRHKSTAQSCSPIPEH
jgi:hypothetical protein